MIRRLIIALLLIQAATGVARAEPITIALFGSAFAATLAGSVVSFIFTAAAAIGASLLMDAIKPKPKASTDTSTQPGIQFDVQMGEDSPIGFTVGMTATAGTRKYIGTWGADGATPNAYLTDVIQIGDLPAPGQPALWVNGQKCTIEWDNGAAQGFPVTEFRVNGRDYLWVRYRDGTQTEVDPFLFGKFGGHPDRPWTAEMILRGCPFLVITALLNRELFTGQLTYLIEPPPTPWYDIRKDSTVGGDGDHRWNVPSTWEPTCNNAVIAYNIIRGVYYGDEWVYGGQKLAAYRLPADNVMAAANECDAERELDDDSTEPQFRCGMEIRGDMEPLTVVSELMKGCSGRIAEVGGMFKLLVGAPGAAVYAFTDGDILVTRGQSLTPFPTLDDTHNGIEATYPEPEEKWETKDAPARYSSELEAADDNRRLATGVHFAAVPFKVQVQQLMRTMIEEDRRFRVHSFHLPPDAYPLEPLDVVSWTSPRNSYLNKKFVINRIVGERTSNQMVLLKEINPGSDYGFPPGSQLPAPTTPSTIVRPPAQPMVSWQAAPSTFNDGDGTQRRPSIQIQFDGNQDDVRAVRVQVRLAGAAALVFDGELPYGAPALGIRAVTLNAVLLPNTAYEARGIFVPYSGRETTWSAWLAVTTPDVGLSSGDLDPGLRDYVRRQLPAQIRQIDFKAQRIAQLAADQDAQNEMLNRAVRTLLSSDGITINETVQIALGVNGKLTGAVFNTIDNNGFVTGTFHYNDGTTAPFTIVATDFYLAAPGINGGEPIPVFTIGTSGGEANVVLHGNIIGDGSIRANHIQVESITSLSAYFGENVRVDGSINGGPDGNMVQSFTDGSIIIFAEEDD